jgi:hypothetical protein
MKKTIYTKWNVLLAACIMAMATFAACEKEEDSAVALDSFGPTPVLRGETIRFIGSNLDKVTAVIFPDNIEVAPTKISTGEITAVIPQAAVNGYITLHYPGGSIITKSQITYADAVTFTAVAGETDPVRAGDVITITGDNLTGVTQVVFSVDVTVERRDFLTQDRYGITLTLPANAQTGDVYLLAGAFETPHLNLDINGPSITSLTPTPLKPGRDTLEITGTNLDLAVSVIFAGDITVDAVPVSATQIKAAVPADAQNGTIKVVSTAGLEYESAATITLVAPGNLSLTAGPYKAGNSVTITGNDLDLVTGVTFAGDADVEEFTYDETTGITVVIPATATDGAITLQCVAGTVTTPDVTLVKPDITSITPATIQAGDAITITGTDLDLVTAVTIGGKDCTIDTQAETEIQAATPMDAAIAGTGTEVALALANGVVVTGTIDVTFPLFCFILELPASNVEIKAGDVLQVTVENSNKLTGVEVNGSAIQHILQGSTLYIAIPANAGGQVSLKLISSNGDATYTINVIASGPVETVVFQGPVELTWSDGGRAVIPASAFENVAAGAIMKIYFTQTDNWGQAQINNGQWGAIPFAELGNDGYIKTDTYGDKSVSEQELELTQDILDNIAANIGTGDFDGAGIVIQGQDWIITKITIVTSAGGGEIIVDETPHVVGWGGEGDGGAFRVYKADLAELQAGSILKFYYTATGDNSQLKIQDANWGAIAIDDPNYDATYGVLGVDAGGSFYEWHMTADIVNTIMTTDDGWGDTALVIAGQELTVTKITIVK